MRPEGALSSLAEIEGVVGSFVGDAGGEPLLDRMPPQVTDAVLRRTLSRLTSMVRCAAACGVDVAHGDLTLGERCLLLRVFDGGLLGVLVGAGADRRAVRAAMREAAADLSLSFGESGEDGEVTTRYRMRTAAAPRAVSGR